MTEKKAPIVVSENAGLNDSIQAFVRYAVVLITVGTAVLGLFKAHDFVGLAIYVQENLGSTLSAILGLVGIATAAYGIFKSKKRGDALVAVAVNPAVPDKVITTKES